MLYAPCNAAAACEIRGASPCENRKRARPFLTLSLSLFQLVFCFVFFVCLYYDFVFHSFTLRVLFVPCCLTPRFPRTHTIRDRVHHPSVRHRCVFAIARCAKDVYEESEAELLSEDRTDRASTKSRSPADSAASSLVDRSSHKGAGDRRVSSNVPFVTTTHKITRLCQAAQFYTITMYYICCLNVVFFCSRFVFRLFFFLCILCWL